MDKLNQPQFMESVNSDLDFLFSDFKGQTLSKDSKDTFQTP